MKGQLINFLQVLLHTQTEESLLHLYLDNNIFIEPPGKMGECVRVTNLKSRQFPTDYEKKAQYLRTVLVSVECIMTLSIVHSGRAQNGEIALSDRICFHRTLVSSSLIHN